jgi:hypothetical protein
MYDNAAASGAPTSVHRGGELVTASQTRSGGQHQSTSAMTQADRRPRPLARRAERIARPARVRIRSRKPWVFARRRLFGWKVRLLTSGTPSSCCPSRMADGRVVRLAGGSLRAGLTGVRFRCAAPAADRPPPRPSQLPACRMSARRDRVGRSRWLAAAVRRGSRSTSSAIRQPTPNNFTSRH